MKTDQDQRWLPKRSEPPQVAEHGHQQREQEVDDADSKLEPNSVSVINLF